MDRVRVRRERTTFPTYEPVASDKNPNGLTAPMSFEVRKGEIVGLFGLVGAGRTETLNLIAGNGKVRRVRCDSTA